MVNTNAQQTKAPTAEVRSPSGGLLGFKQRLLGRNRCGSITPQPSSDIVGFPTAEITEAIGNQQQQQQQNLTKQQQARKRNASRRATQQAPLRNRNNSYNANNPKDSGAGQRGEATP